MMKILRFLFLSLTVAAMPHVSLADWSFGIGVGDSDRHEHGHEHYHWHDHPGWGYHEHYLPANCMTIFSEGIRYSYCDGLYYTYAGGGDYVLVNPPVGVYVNAIPPDFHQVIINGRSYYTDDGVYYVFTRYGFKVVPPPVVYAQPQVIVAQPQPVVINPPAAGMTTAVVDIDTFPVNVPNNSGGYTAVIVKRSGSGYVGPQGEYYATFPTVAQLKAMYAK